MPDPVPSTMQAMVLQAPGKALQAVRVPVPAPGPGQVLVRVRACGICRTDLHILDGELQEPPAMRLASVVSAPFVQPPPSSPSQATDDGPTMDNDRSR